jgi:hypothetical protein
MNDDVPKEPTSSVSSTPTPKQQENEDPSPSAIDNETGELIPTPSDDDSPPTTEKVLPIPEPMPDDEDDDEDVNHSNKTRDESVIVNHSIPTKNSNDEKGGNDDLEAQESPMKQSAATATPTKDKKDGIVKKTTKKKPEMNPKFKDVQETGKWGEMSNKEMFIAIAAFVLIVVAVVVVVVVVVLNTDSTQAEFVPAPTRAPTPPPTTIPASEELAIVRMNILNSPVTSPLASDLPDDPSFYEGLMDDGSASPQQKAMEWLLYQDQLKDPEESTLRWAMASIYYQMGGPNWASSEGWLSSDPVCEWEHVHCNAASGTLQEIDLDEQGVTGNIALEFALLGDDIQSILMKRNQITGPIPGKVFASLPSLGILYLDNNQLTGTVPVEFSKGDGIFRK